MDNDALHHRLIDGDPQRPWLVFLHEGLGCTAMWSDFAERLCALSGCRGLLYDRRGHGRSPATDVPRTLHYLHAAALQELPDMLARLIAGQPYLLIGHSDGGSIALLHAAERPPLLRAAITVAAHVFVEPMTLDGIRRAVEAWQLGKLQGLARYHGERSTALFEAWSQTWLSPGSATGTSSTCCRRSAARCWCCRAATTSTAAPPRSNASSSRSAVAARRPSSRTADMYRTARPCRRPWR